MSFKTNLKQNSQALIASEKDFKSIFEIMFSHKDMIICEENDGFRVKKYTYGQAYELILKTASGLKSKVGANHQFIAVEFENSYNWIVAFWATLISGNKPYLVNTRYPENLSNAILKTLKVQYSLCLGKSRLEVEAIDVTTLAGQSTCGLEDMENEIAFSSSATSMNEVICFYSGFQIAEQILNFDSIVKECPRMVKMYKGQVKQLAFLPFYHVFGLFAVYFWFSFFGAAMVFLRDYSADTILKTCRRHQVSHIFAVPMLWHTVEQKVLKSVKELGEKQEKKFEKGLKSMTRLQNAFPRLGPEFAKKAMSKVTDKLFGPSVLFCINGGSYLRNSAAELLNGLGYSIHNGYGMSEIGITSVDLRVKPKHLNQNSIGRPFDAVEYKIDENGVLLVKGSTLCTKKLVNGEERVVDGWFNTDDNMIEVDGYYFIHGRQSDIVIGDNGENINPDRVEQAFCISAAKALSVLGLPKDNGEELSLIIQISPYLNNAQLNEIKKQVYDVNSALPHVSAVRRFYFTTDPLMPENSIKVSRKQLVKLVKSGEVKLTDFDQSVAEVKGDSDTQLSKLEAEVAQIIAENLAVDVSAVTPDAHIFFDLGGTSIQYFSILTALAERFGIEGYNQGDTYCYTLKDICEYIERRL